MNHDELLKFMVERHKIYEKRQRGLPKPWTDDPILQSYRFCNVYRELDTETIWLRKNWLADNHQDRWFAALVFRFINWHETAEDLGHPVPWNPEKFIRAIDKRKKSGKKVYSGAYMISTHGVKEDKARYIAKSLTKIWDNREFIRPRKNENLDSFYVRLKGCFDIGSFLAAQVIADIKFFPPYDARTPDWWSFVAPGPGSRRGLNYVVGRHPDAHWKEQDWYKAFYELYEIMLAACAGKLPCSVSAQNLQNCLCEFSKYKKALHGHGRPKMKYDGGY